MTPAISIIIPCYNRINLLKETLKSVEAAIKELYAEIILVDDGSEPPVETQIGDFSHLPIKFIRQKNSGLTTSRFNGLMHSSGDYIQFLDSDDQIAESKLIIQIEVMKETGADVSHTDILQIFPDQDSSPLITTFRHSINPAEFYVDIQPAPHSPIFKREYLVNTLKEGFIPLTREYDSIGEIWFYYNLSPFPAKIVKIDEPLTIVIHHTEERLTNHWERLGLCALSLQLNFSKNRPKSAPFSKDSCTYVGKAAFNTFRGLPYDIYKPFQNGFLTVWESLGKTSLLGGGKYFNSLSKLIGVKNAALLFRRLSNNKYERISTIELTELISKTKAII